MSEFDTIDATFASLTPIDWALAGGIALMVMGLAIVLSVPALLKLRTRR